MNKVLYIAGYGRSGSTVLDVVLGNHPDIVSVGELTYLADDWSDPGRLCACGASYADCGFWGGLSEARPISEATRAVVRTIERRRGTVPALLDRWDAETKRAYREAQRQLFAYITETSGASIVVDSSKSAGDAAMRFYALSAIAGLDVYVLHLVRDGRSTMASCVRRGSNWAMEGHRPPPALPGLRAAAGWTMANLWTVAIARRYVPKNRYMRVRFEDLITHPAHTLERIGAFIGVNVEMLTERIAHDEPFDVGHNVGGNRVRMEREIHFKSKDQKDHKNKELRWHQHLAFGAIGGWLDHYLSAP